MKKLTSIIGISITLFSSPTFSMGQHKYINATVVSVHDGDTIRAISQNGQKLKIRLAYIDAPELNQAGGYASKTALSHLILNQTVQLEIFNTDQYQRQVAKVIHNGKDINLKQIAEGNAWHYRSIAKQQQSKTDYQKYQQSQITAKNNKKGLWQNTKVIAPWTFRKQYTN